MGIKELNQPWTIVGYAHKNAKSKPPMLGKIKAPFVG